jgi:hypothetical protein
VKEETGDLLADSHNILNRWKIFSNKQLAMRVYTKLIMKMELE